MAEGVVTVVCAAVLEATATVVEFPICGHESHNTGHDAPYVGISLQNRSFFGKHNAELSALLLQRRVVVVAVVTVVVEAVVVTVVVVVVVVVVEEMVVVEVKQVSHSPLQRAITSLYWHISSTTVCDDAVHTFGSRTLPHIARVLVVDVVVVLVTVLLVDDEMVVVVVVVVVCVSVAAVEVVGHVLQRFGHLLPNSAAASEMSDEHNVASFPHHQSSGRPSHRVLQTPHNVGHRTLTSAPI
jgi:hypothetical protein